MRKDNRKGPQRSNFDRGSSNNNWSHSSTPREMHKATCGDCGNECEVPFNPTKGKPVYCKECYRKRNDRF